MRDIKLIISDIDGTLFTSKEKISPRTANAINKAREKGILFGVATGRHLDGLEKLAVDTGMDKLCDIYVGCHGAHIIDKSCNLDKHEEMLSGKDSLEIFNHFKDLDVNIIVGLDKKVYGYKSDADTEYITKVTGYPEIPLIPEEVFKSAQAQILITCVPSYMDKVIQHSKKLINKNYRGFCTWETCFEYVPASVSKSKGIKEIANIHGFELENVLAFGDADNDLEMLRDCGIGVCMENGLDSAKAISDYITSSNDNDGIAKFIEENIL